VEGTQFRRFTLGVGQIGYTIRRPTGSHSPFLLRLAVPPRASQVRRRAGALAAAHTTATGLHMITTPGRGHGLSLDESVALDRPIRRCRFCRAERPPGSDAATPGRLVGSMRQRPSRYLVLDLEELDVEPGRPFGRFSTLLLA